MSLVILLAIGVYLCGFAVTSILIGWREPFADPTLGTAFTAVFWFAVIPHGLLMLAGQAAAQQKLPGGLR